MARRSDESHNLSLEDERAQLAETRAALPGWHVWVVWHCGNRTWHAMPAHLVPANGRPYGAGSTRPQPDRVTTHDRHDLTRKCDRRGLENWS